MCPCIDMNNSSVSVIEGRQPVYYQINPLRFNRSSVSFFRDKSFRKKKYTTNPTNRKITISPICTHKLDMIVLYMSSLSKSTISTANNMKTKINFNFTQRPSYYQAQSNSSAKKTCKVCFCVYIMPIMFPQHFICRLLVIVLA